MEQFSLVNDSQDNSTPMTFEELNLNLLKRGNLDGHNLLEKSLS